MQLSTVNSGGSPWVCTVYFVADEQRNLYWLSYPTRRHSQEIADNNKVAAAIVVKADLPVIGIQVEGIAEKVTDAATVKKIMDRYIAKYDAGKTFYDRFVAGENQHQLYVLKPQHTYLFDEVNYALDDRQEVL